jgi:hypothetical protein
MKLTKRDDGKYELQIWDGHNINCLSQKEFDELVNLVAHIRKFETPPVEQWMHNLADRLVDIFDIIAYDDDGNEHLLEPDELAEYIVCYAPKEFIE